MGLGFSGVVGGAWGGRVWGWARCGTGGVGGGGWGWGRGHSLGWGGGVEEGSRLEDGVAGGGEGVGRGRGGWAVRGAGGWGLVVMVRAPRGCIRGAGGDFAREEGSKWCLEVRGFEPAQPSYLACKVIAAVLKAETLR
jgi:hypothetical protein